MKKIHLLLAACAMLVVMGSCGNSQNQSQNQNEVNDEGLIFVSSDLAFFELHGHVKSCNYAVDPTGQHFDCVEYDRSGKIISVDGYNPFELEEPWSELNEETSTMEDHCQWNRDDHGQIATYYCDWSGATFTWTKGLPSSVIRSHEDMMYKYELEYNSNGNLVKQTVYGGTDEELEDNTMALDHILEYTYLEFDDQGNWIRRIEKWTDAELDFLNGEEEFTRSIEYYK